ncbi:1-acyl-sn-glycerol-3-phosphate acyltransferase [Synechococcus sp. MU1625]|uniref:lysophospholipid acyltransferase family protein n=1 Tax=Synechococcus sp. MU1625 TaxID=2508347 RepID=UPI001CF87022|nr:1-acyl-sn-glycerol-3-phosphate acyltransferase [Synechococcus sp. MU1625]MCB4399044.1 glycerol acyltransferase [Synechococcus sp. MU1625]
MPRASTQNARPALRRLPTRASRIVQDVVSWVLPLLFRSQGLEISSSDASEALARAFAAQQSGACNLLIAFRHPSTRDPLVLADLFWNRVPRAAQQHHLQLARPIQLRFLYDRGIPIWAGPVIGWLLQRSGGIAIHRGRLDRPALAQARAALVQGRYPLVVAPEGATNNLSGEMAPLEPGVAQLAFWAAEDLEKAGDARQLEVLPVGIQYSWRKHNWGALDARLNALERHLGIPTAAAYQGNPETTRRERLIQIGMNLLKALEQLERLKPDPEKSFSERIGAYRLHGLAKAEAHFGLRAVGNLQERCRRIEQAAWDRIYRDGVDQLPPLERSLADWEAREADLQLTRMRLVEHFTSVSGHYISDRSDFDRFAEMLLLVEEAIGWIEDKPWKGQPSLGPQRVELRLGRALPVRPRLNGYLRNRRESMQLFMQDLEQALIEVMPDTAL